MAYIPQYDYDVFISYAHTDNDPIPPAERGWVQVFEVTLTKYLARKFGRPGSIGLWIDQNKLRGNQEPDGHIPQCVRKSALFLAILSPGYVASHFCRLELDAYIESLGGNASERIFVVYHTPVPEKRGKIPEPLRKPRNYQFWAQEDGRVQTFAYPVPGAKQQEYYNLMEDLAEDIINKLDELKGSVEPQPASPQSVTGPTVLLAEVSEDLEPLRDDIRRYLKDEGIGVLPTGNYPSTRQEFEQAFLTDLSKCTAFVQLLGPQSGDRPLDAPDGFGWLQFELAKRELAKRGLPDRVLQWRSPKLNLSEVALPLQQRLLELETVQARPILDFKASIVRAARKPPAEKKKLPGTEPVFFINCAAADVAQAEAIREAIRENFGDKVRSELSVGKADEKAGELHERLKGYVIECDGMLVVYGATNPEWVDSQLREYQKIASKREKEPRLSALVEGPPDPKAPPSIRLPGLQTIRIDKVIDAIRQVVTS
jgi:hypothetical protein